MITSHNSRKHIAADKIGVNYKWKAQEKCDRFLLKQSLHLSQILWYFLVIISWFFNQITTPKYLIKRPWNSELKNKLCQQIIPTHAFCICTCICKGPFARGCQRSYLMWKKEIGHRERIRQAGFGKQSAKWKGSVFTLADIYQLMSQSLI